MIRSSDRAPLLPRTRSSDCLQACYGAHAASPPEEVDAIVRKQVDAFVRGAPQEVAATGTRLLRQVIATGQGDPSAVACTWCATLSRMELSIPAFASARRIAAFRIEQSNEIEATLGAIRQRLIEIAPAYADAVDAVHQSMGALLRSIDWSGWTAACLAKMHTAQRLVALDALVASPTYAVALECSRLGAITGRQRLDAGADFEAIKPSQIALRVVQLLGCEAVTVRMALAERPQQDPVGTRKMFKIVYAPAIAELLDRMLLPEALSSLARSLATPAVQEAFEAETFALPRTSEETAALLRAAVAARMTSEHAGRCL